MERLQDRLETVIAVLLGLAAVLAAVAGYQATLRDGDSIKSFNEGIRSINDANGFFNEATQTVTRDTSLFLTYAQASQEGNEDMATYLEGALMDDNLRGAVKEWKDDASNEIATPLDAPSYELAQQAEGERLTQLTDRQFAQARTLDDQGDQFALVGVIVATSLFFLGIAGVARVMRTRLVATGAGSLTLVAAFGFWVANL